MDDKKNFDSWNLEKKLTHFSEDKIECNEYEVWLCKIGLNIGVEIDGKRELFLRPIIILRKFNNKMVLIIPVTSKNKLNKYYLRVLGRNNKIHTACISHIRTVSTKRLIRKIDEIKKIDHEILIHSTLRMIEGNL